MERIQYRTNGLNVMIIKTEKFKTTDFIINFRNYLQKDTVTKRALVPYVLKAGSVNYPTKKDINKKLEALYGASLGISVNKQGLVHVLSFRMSLVNDAYLEKKSDLLDEGFAFLHEVVFNPKLEDGIFSAKLVNEEKRLLNDHFKAIYDDKIRYSYDKLIEIMCKNENYRIRSIGCAEDVPHITAKDIYQEYQSMLKEDTVDFLLVGDVDAERVKGLIDRLFPFEERDEVINVIDEESNEIRKVNKIVENQDISQAKLNIGYRTYTKGTEKEYYHLMLMNAMLGVYPNSLLFKNVREKHSLCYYISSNIDRAKPIMVIYAGINNKDYDEAVNVIREQIEAMQKGDFPEELLVNTKKALINEILELGDNPIGLLASNYTSLLYHEVFDAEDFIKKINEVNREDVINAAGKIKEDSIFFLTKEEAE